MEKLKWSKPQITEIKVKMTEKTMVNPPPDIHNGKSAPGHEKFGLEYNDRL